MTEQIHNAVFLISFLFCVGIFLFKTYSVMNYWVGSKDFVYNFNVAVLLFVGYLLCWGMGLFVVLVDPLLTLFRVLFALTSFLLILNVLYLLIEVFVLMANVAQMPLKAYNAKDFYGSQK